MRAPSKTLIALALALGVCANALSQAGSQGSYDQNWFRAVAALMTIASLTSLDPQKPDPGALASFKQATDSLEQAASGLSRAVPPEQSAAAHVAVPRILMVVGAARDSLHAIEAGKSAEIAASLEWLDDAILRAREALSRVASGKL